MGNVPTPPGGSSGSGKTTTAPTQWPTQTPGFVPYGTTAPKGTKPIGVGGTYRAPQQSAIAPPGNAGASAVSSWMDSAKAPLYYSGYEYTPAGWGADQIVQLQQMMVAAGLVPLNKDGTPKNLIPGAWDPASREAYTELLREANQAGVTWQEQLATRGKTLQSLGGAIATGGGSGGSSLPTIQLTNPDDIRATVDAASPNLIGRKLSPDEMNQFITAWHSVESSAQQTANNANGGTITSPPSLGTFVKQQLETQHPAEAFTTQQIGANQDLLQTLMTRNLPGGLGTSQGGSQIKAPTA